MTSRHPLRSKLPVLAGSLFLLLFTAGIVYLVRDFILNADVKEKPRVQQISLIKPPPPKDLPKPPEPEKIEKPKEEVQVDQPPPDPQEAQNNEPPPGENLAVEGEGGAGDGFGLLGKKNVRDITTIGHSGDRDTWYGRMISRHIEDALRRDKRLQGVNYQVVAQLWFDSAGSVQRVSLAKGSGDATTDETLREAMQSLPPLREVLPGDLPQPVRVRVSSRA